MLTFWTSWPFILQCLNTWDTTWVSSNEAMFSTPSLSCKRRHPRSFGNRLRLSLVTAPCRQRNHVQHAFLIRSNDWQTKWSAKHLYMVHEGSADQCQFPGSSPRSRDFSIKKKCWPNKPTERFGPQNTAFFSSHFTCGDGHLLLVPSSLAENEGNPRSGSPGCWSSAEHKRSQSKHPVLPVRVWRNISTNKKLTGIQFPKLGQHAASDSSSATGSVGLAKRGTASQVKRWSYIFKNSFFAFHFWKKILPNSKKVDL